MTEVYLNHLEIYSQLYTGNTKKAIEEFIVKTRSLSFTSPQERTCYLTSLNQGIYNYILIQENVSLHSCCLKNEKKILKCTGDTLLAIGENIIRSYGYCYEYVIQRHKNEHIRKALEYIHKNLCENITLDMVSKEANINKCYLCDLFKKEVCQSFSEYVLSQRIQLAKKLLLTTPHSIQAIAEKCGFQNQSYFCTCFKKIIGVTPTKLRKCYN